uniref:Uncharacterized protein n=1 Tax=Caenorhabditis japonica TaxID=281687 RepID=A0A8R1ENK9_CAEJA
MPISTSFRSFDDDYACNDDGNFTYSTTEQKRVEALVYEHFNVLVLEPCEAAGEEDLTDIKINRQNIPTICSDILRIVRGATRP